MRLDIFTLGERRRTLRFQNGFVFLVYFSWTVTLCHYISGSSQVSRYCRIRISSELSQYLLQLRECRQRILGVHISSCVVEWVSQCFEHVEWNLIYSFVRCICKYWKGIMPDATELWLACIAIPIWPAKFICVPNMYFKSWMIQTASVEEQRFRSWTRVKVNHPWVCYW